MTTPEPSASTEATSTEATPTAAAPSAEPARPRFDADGRERPRFVLGLPSDPALDALVQAFERGDFKYVRDHAESVSKNATDPKVKAAAADLRRRIEPDANVVLLLALAAGLFLFLVGWVYLGR